MELEDSPLSPLSPQGLPAPTVLVPWSMAGQRFAGIRQAGPSLPPPWPRTAAVKALLSRGTTEPSRRPVMIFALLRGKLGFTGENVSKDSK